MRSKRRLSTWHDAQDPSLRMQSAACRFESGELHSSMLRRLDELVDGERGLTWIRTEK